MQRHPIDGHGVILAVCAALGFSVKAILVKLAYGLAPVEAVTLVTLRMAFALPVFAWVGLRETHRSEPLAPRDWAAVVSLGVLGYYGASMLDFVGLKYVSAGLERLILFTYPPLTVLLSALFLGQKVGRRALGALVLCYLGVAAAFAHDLSLSSPAGAVFTGGALVFGSSVTYAVYLTGSGPMIGRLGTARFTALAMLVATAATLSHFMATQRLSALALPPRIYGLALAMAILSTVLPSFALSAAIRRIGSGRAALIGTIGPILTIALGWWILGEPMSAWQLVGTALVVGGVVLVSRGEG